MVAAAPTSAKSETEFPASGSCLYLKIKEPASTDQMENGVDWYPMYHFPRARPRSPNPPIKCKMTSIDIQYITFYARDVRWGVEEYEEYERRGSPQAPPHVLRLLLKRHCGIVGVTGRQELDTRARIGRSVVRSAVRSFGRSVVRSFGRSFGRSVGRSVGRSDRLTFGHFWSHRGGVPRYGRVGSENCKTAADHSDANPYYTASNVWPRLEPSWWDATIWSSWVRTL
jgi:hypothetical protein